jgi:hypothetical protein
VRFPSRVRYAIWLGEPEQQLCRGVFPHGICVFALDDVAHLHGRPFFAVNKFDIRLTHFHAKLGLECLEEWRRNRSLAPETPLDMGQYPFAT